MSTVDRTQHTPTDGTRPSIVPKVAVVLLSKDEPALDDSLRALRPQLDAHDGECIVVDASEGRLEYIRNEYPWVKWIDYVRPVNVGITIPHQRNVGVRAATAPIIAFCDAGGIPTEDWLETLVAPIIDGRHDVTCGPVRSTRASVYKVINDLADGTVVDTVLTANLAFTRDAFDAIDGFDERYQYGSDADFAWRLIDAGHPPISIQAAVMGMDWGDWNLQKKRSWRYGKARARLFRYHPARRVRILTRSPEVIVYPTAVLGTFATAVVALFTGWWALLAGPLAVFAVLFARNAKTGKALGVMADHIIYSTSFISEMVLSLFRRLPTSGAYAMHMPKDSGPYQPYLIDALDEVGVPSCYLPSPTPSKTINLALLPLTTLCARVTGVRVVHVHWLHDFSLSWSRSAMANKAVFAWFRLWLSWSKMIGLDLVWTAHNVLPHNPIFTDDVAARIALLSHTDAVIAHTAAAADEVHGRFGGPTPYVIAQGATPPPTGRDRDASRGRLGWDVQGTTLVVVGKVEPYKGIVTLLTELERRLGAGDTDPLHGACLVIAGSCSDQNLKARIDGLVRRLGAAGLALSFDERALTENEFWDHLHAADLALFPFDAITNSGSLVAALSAGVGAVVTDLPAFAEITTPAVVKAGPEIAAYVDAVLELVEGPADARDRMGSEGLAWAAGRDWAHVARATRAVYENVQDAKGQQ